MKYKIIVFLSPSVTGAERVSITLAKSLDERKYNVLFAIIGNGTADIAKYIPSRYPILTTTIDDLPSFIEHQSPDEVFCSLIDLNPFVYQAATLVGGIKVVLRNNYRLADLPQEIVTQAAEAYRNADTIIAQTEEMRHELIKTYCIPQDKVIVIENPIDKEYINICLSGCESPYPDDNEIHYCWVGRYEWIKGPDILLDWFDRACTAENNCSLYLIGKVEETSRCYQVIASRVNSSHYRNKIHIAGFDSNPYKWIKYRDALIMSSRSEACSNVVREAQYLGTRVINVQK